MTEELNFSAEVQRDIFGRHDRYIRKIEKNLGIAVVARDGVVRVSGEEHHVNAAVSILNQLAGLSGKGSPIEDQKVDYALEMKEQAPPDMLLTMDEDTICHTINGRPVKPKTIGQKKYIDAAANGFYTMKPEYDTQRKVEAAFEGKTTDKDIWIRDGLYALISDVLFVRDHRNPNLFHPRISVQFDFIYESLNDSDKYVFNNLYNDYFYRRNNQYWYTEAMKKLPRLVEATRMLVCAEDLGMVPDCVAWVMNKLRILSLEIQSMPKDPTTRFGKLKHNPYRSVCTISSHDMPTLRQWWDEDEQRTQEYYSTMLHRGGAAPHPLPGWLARDIVSRQLTSPSMLCILSIQDWMAIDEQLRLKDPNAERINIPANPKHYWRYRMHVSIEELMSNRSFTENVKELVLQSGRK